MPDTPSYPWKLLATLGGIGALGSGLIWSQILTGARGSYHAELEIMVEPLPETSKPTRRYALALQREAAGIMAAPNAAETRWKNVVGSSREQIFGAFSAGWTWRGYERRNYPYADCVIVEIRGTNESPRYQVLPIPWNAARTRAIVTIPSL